MLRVRALSRLHGGTDRRRADVLQSSVRHAARVGFWNRMRRVRNPHTRFPRRVSMFEDLAHTMQRYHHWAYFYELKKWRAQFRSYVDHRVTDWEVENRQMPKGPHLYKIIHRLLTQFKGYPLIYKQAITRADNPYAKSHTSFQTTTFRSDLSTSKVAALVRAGVDLQVATRMVKDRRQQYKKKLQTLRKDGRLLVSSFQQGVSGADYQEVKKKESLLHKEDSGAATQSVGIPARLRRLYDFDEETGEPKLKKKPVKVVFKGGVDVTIDHVQPEIEVDAQPSDSGGFYSARSRLPDGFAFPKYSRIM
eukprot:TRINITY_DN37819_c0_g1_i1.p1 TRINITY_DN37819_c0_g1~~TRINITY_DN37819_c0_g1_i1.p1  ORF type:complete len:323 (+),score=76.65 TRINITY_DN37819_c0_g1_i1:54-971(+)